MFSIKLLLFISLVFSGVHYAQAVDHQGVHRKIKNKLTRPVVIPDAIQEAKVILMPTGIIHEFGFNEFLLKKVGCTFITSDIDDIRQLRNIINQANIKRYPYKIDFVRRNNGFVYESEFYPRNGIYLNLTDGASIKLLFEKGYSNINNIRGEYSKLPTNNKQPVYASINLLSELFFWANNTGKLLKSNEPIPYNINVECDFFLSRKGFYKDLYRNDR